jgi:hypothetical protein
LNLNDNTDVVLNRTLLKAVTNVFPSFEFESSLDSSASSSLQRKQEAVDMQTWVSESAKVMLLEPLMLLNVSLILMNASAKQNPVEAKCVAKQA